MTPPDEDSSNHGRPDGDSGPVEGDDDETPAWLRPGAPPPEVPLPKAERRMVAKTRRNVLERARRMTAEEEFQRALQTDAGKRAMVGAARFMSRRGLRMLKKLALEGEMGALRQLVELTKTLALIRVQEAAIAQRERTQPEARRGPFHATWPNEADKT
jgi:hypothetical protein